MYNLTLVIQIWPDGSSERADVNRWDLTQFQQSLLLTRNLAIGKLGDAEPEMI